MKTRNKALTVFLCCSLVVVLYPATHISSLAPVMCCDATTNLVSTSPAAVSGTGKDMETVPGELIVTCKSPSDGEANMPSELEELAHQYGVESSKVLTAGFGNVGETIDMKLADSSRLDSFSNALRAQDIVASVQPNYIYHLADGDASQTAGSAENLTVSSTSVNDPYAGNMSYGTLSGDYLGAWDSNGNFGADVYDAWDEAKCNGSVTVAVLDTGCLATHEDLKANIDTAHMKDMYSNTAPGIMPDYVGHGTHVCGLVAAQANNGKGIAGSSYDATVLPIKVFNNGNENTAGADTSTIIEGYAYLQQLMQDGSLTDLHIINMSLGGYEVDEYDAVLKDAIDTFYSDYNVLTVCAGGNGDDDGNALTTASYPSDFTNVLSVTALGINGANTQWSDYNMNKDISAPGLGLDSTINTSTSSYENMSGTSMASPLVAGIAALLWSVDPELTPEQATEAIKDTANSVVTTTNYHDSTKTGSAGAIDAKKAVDYVLHNYVADDGRMDITAGTLSPVQNMLYTGAALTPSVVLSYGDKKLVQGTDYTVKYVNNIAVGTAQMVISGLGSYKGTKRAVFNICNDLTAGRIQAISMQTYTGSAIEPTLSVFYGTTRLTKGVDYTVKYLNNILGDSDRYGQAVVSGIGVYLGMLTAKFQITGVPATEIGTVVRIAGDDAIQTSVIEAEDEFPDGCPTVVMANASDTVDMLCASDLAGALGVPLLLSEGATVRSEIATAITTLKPKKVLLVGDIAQLSSGLANTLSGYPTIRSVIRLAGHNSVETNAEVYLYGKSVGVWGSGLAVVASADNPVTASSALSVAISKAAPLFFVNASGNLGTDAKAYIKLGGYGDVLIVGDTGCVAASTQTYLSSLSCSVQRCAGSDEYATSLAVNTWAIDKQYLSWNDVAYESIDDIASGIVAAVTQGKDKAPLLLVSQDEKALSNIDVLGSQAGSIVEVRFFGGSDRIISNLIEQAVSFKNLNWGSPTYRKPVL